MANQQPPNNTTNSSNTRNPNPVLWKQLQSIFDLDLPVTTQLLQLLEGERNALEKRSYGNLQTIITDKHALLEQLEKHASVRQQVLTQAGFENEQSTLASADQHAPQVAQAWRKLAEQWASCQKINETNERISKRTRLVTGQILDLLRGQTNQQKLYDDKGNAHNTGAGRSITSA
jgi:flagella synthesis protein FlgN